MERKNKFNQNYEIEKYLIIIKKALKVLKNNKNKINTGRKKNV